MLVGELGAVRSAPIGTWLSRPAAEGDTRLWVVDHVLLPDLGGVEVSTDAGPLQAQVAKLGTSADVDPATETVWGDWLDLAAPITASAPQGSAVTVPGAATKYAMVQVGEPGPFAGVDTDMLEAVVPHHLSALLADGIYDVPGRPVHVNVDLVGGLWTLVDVPGRLPTVRTDALAPEMRELPTLVNEAVTSAADALERADLALVAADGVRETYSVSPPPDTPPEGTGEGHRWIQVGTLTTADGQQDVVVAEWRREAGAWTPVPPRTVSASLLTSGVIRAGVTVTVGDPAQRHSVLSGSGLAVVDPSPDGPVPSTILGGVDEHGDPVDQLVIGGGIAGIDPQGVVIGTGAVIDGDPLFNVAPGNIAPGSMPSLTDVADEAMRGEQAITSWVADLPTVRGADWTGALGDLQYDAITGAGYEIRFDSMISMTEGCEYVDIGFRHVYGGGTPKVDSPLLGFRRVEQIKTGRITTASLRLPYTATQTGPHRVLLTLRPNAGAAYLYGDATWRGSFSIHRTTMRSEGGSWTPHDGGVPRVKPADPTPPPVSPTPVAPAPRRRQQTWTSQWYSSWRDGVDTRGSAQFGVWGGARRYSQFGIPASMALALKGATVHAVKIGVEITHVGYSSPGWLYIGASSYTNRTTRPNNPSGFSGATYRTPLWSSGFRWTAMPASWGPGIGNETIGSVTLGENARNAMADYGHAATVMKFWADYTK